MIVFRLIATGSAFTEYAVGATILIKSVPARHRGGLIGIMAAGWPARTALSTIITFYSVPNLGWRSAFFIAAIPAFIIIVIRLFVKESPDFKREKVARENLTSPFAVESHFTKMLLQAINTFTVNYRTLSKGKHLKNSILIWMYINSSVFSYSLLIWFAPYFMRDAFGLDLVQTTYITGMGSLVSILGFISCGWLDGKIGFRKTNLIYLPIAMALIVWKTSLPDDYNAFLKGFFLWNFFDAGVWVIIPGLFTEPFPVSIRGTAAAVNSASCWLGWGLVSTCFELL